ncbi:hypothetical protein E2P81_ATG09725 [Venturia nashicola]|uniref:Uncharacterized protein n=1 Tax=Venturia nashicola TaxID=86259 RepID=A0A4Z1NR72_9PEZI|nr:hypothetical protein E6O75_ATG09937 [Venturia nashicola]TLD26068.1 hypothetical protein E2P81_ATG09725 [Venturia nashicola]
MSFHTIHNLYNLLQPSSFLEMSSTPEQSTAASTIPALKAYNILATRLQLRCAALTRSHTLNVKRKSGLILRDLLHPLEQVLHSSDSHQQAQEQAAEYYSFVLLRLKFWQFAQLSRHLSNSGVATSKLHGPKP